MKEQNNSDRDVALRKSRPKTFIGVTQARGVTREARDDVRRETLN